MDNCSKDMQSEILFFYVYMLGLKWRERWSKKCKSIPKAMAGRAYSQI